MPNLFEIAGRETLSQLDYVGSLNIQLWATLRGIRSALPLVGNRHRWHAAIQQMLEIGVHALPMAALMAMCTGFILAMQGASELRRFGALHYVIDLVAVGFTRELGPLLTAIAVSGRSGSAFAAEIGTMTVTEEIDALKVMAFEPVEFVLAPKYLAALVTVPCLSIGLELFRHFRWRAIHVLQHPSRSVALFPICTELDSSAGPGRRPDQGGGIRHYRCARGMPGRPSCPGRAGGSGPLDNHGGCAINLLGYRRRRHLHEHLLLCGKDLNVHHLGSRSDSRIRRPPCARCST
jgi:Permease MlaE